MIGKNLHGNAHEKIFQDFEIKDLEKCHDLYVQNDILLYDSDTLLLVDVFGNFWNMHLELYELDPVMYLSAPGLASKAALKNTKVKLDFLTDTDVLLMVGKGIRGGIC